MLQELHQPVMINCAEVASNVRIEDPADLLEAHPDRKRIERHMGLSPRSESVREAEEVYLVDGIEHFGRMSLF